jgi:hypothetical protein
MRDSDSRELCLSPSAHTSAKIHALIAHLGRIPPNTKSVVFSQFKADMRDSDSRELWADQVQERGELGEDNGLGVWRERKQRALPTMTSSISKMIPQGEACL